MVPDATILRQVLVIDRQLEVLLDVGKNSASACIRRTMAYSCCKDGKLHLGRLVRGCAKFCDFDRACGRQRVRVDASH